MEGEREKTKDEMTGIWNEERRFSPSRSTFYFYALSEC